MQSILPWNMSSLKVACTMTGIKSESNGVTETMGLLLRLQQFFETKAPACQQSECPRSHSMQFLLSTRACI